MTDSEPTSLLTQELAELQAGSVSLFKHLPDFRNGLTCPQRQQVLADIEAAVGEHLAQLDRIVSVIPLSAERCVSDVTRGLDGAFNAMQQSWPSTSRDADILQAVQRAQLFLLGSCGYALRCARSAGLGDIAALLELSMRCMRAAGLPLLLGADAPEGASSSMSSRS
jgi:hypothetical protein